MKRRTQFTLYIAAIGQRSGATFTTNKKALHKCVNQVWNHAICWEHSHATHRQLLVVLLERVLEHLDKPMLLTDYLMDSMDIGYALSRHRGKMYPPPSNPVPAPLILNSNILLLVFQVARDYPNIYTKLYSMFDADIFTTRYKARLFYLADIFLSSTHLPALLVAAFVKRLARLCLVAPPQDIHIMILFIGNLILRHPQLKGLINHPTGGEVRPLLEPNFALSESGSSSLATSGSLGPVNSRNLVWVSPSGWISSIATHGPSSSSFTISTNSGTTPLISDRMSPNNPSLTACGFTKHSVVFSKRAEVLGATIILSSQVGKNISSSLLASSCDWEPWTILCCISFPKQARKLSGLSFRAFSGSVGPITSLQRAAASFPTSFMARHGDSRISPHLSNASGFNIANVTSINFPRLDLVNSLAKSRIHMLRDRI
uniref:CCAAT-binding factor domain-containing protein n=1 Tax=Timema bartmani TaxID=61472 RepID=A0A7R9EZ76_9NEOP|nr:unnamed protein product [Timema bartmani]